MFASVNLIWRQFLFAGLVCTTSVTNMKLLLPTNHLLKTDLLHRGFRRNQIIFFWWFSAITMIIIKILMVDASYIQRQIPLCVETKAHQHVFLCHNDQRRRNISKSTLLSFNSSLYFLAIMSAFIILLFELNWRFKDQHLHKHHCYQFVHLPTSRATFKSHTKDAGTRQDNGMIRHGPKKNRILRWNYN